MDDFNRIEIGFKPGKIDRKDVVNNDASTKSIENSTVIATKLLDHLAIIKDFRDKIDAVDYLIENAEKLSGNIRFDVSEKDIQRAIKSIGYSGNYIDFNVFKEAVTLLVQAYGEVALIELTGVRNEHK